MDDRFSIARQDRDAWAAIRGYVYQVDTMILRWLQLQADEALELVVLQKRFCGKFGSRAKLSVSIISIRRFRG